MRWWTIRLILGASAAVLLGCGADPARDGDDDGLADFQEELLGTDPADPDSDDDGLLDGEDPEPLANNGNGLLHLAVTATPGELTDATWLSTLTVKVTESDGSPAPAVALTAEVTGQEATLTSFEKGDGGTWTAQLSAVKEQVVGVRVSASQEGRPTQSRTVKVYFISAANQLPQAGLNPPPYDGQGAVNGFLRVFVIHGDSGVLPGQPPEGVEGAYVLVELTADPTVRWEGETGPDFRIDFEDPLLVGPVNVTVARDGFKAFSAIGANASHVCLPLAPFDMIPGLDDDKTGVVHGTVVGFDGSTGVSALPPTDAFGTWSIGIVQVGLVNKQLASLSMGSVLSWGNIEKVDCGPANLFGCVPPNLVIYQGDGGTSFTIEAMPPGTHLISVLAGTAEGVIDSLQNPYDLRIQPTSLGFAVVTVEAGETVDALEVPLTIDLLAEAENGGASFDVNLGDFPADPLSGAPLANGLLLPVVDTGSYGFIWADVNSDYNKPDFSNPLQVVYPGTEHPTVGAFDMDLFYMTVGLAGRRAYLGADPPGISTKIVRAQVPDGPLGMDDWEAWLALPRGLSPTPPGPFVPSLCPSLAHVPDPPGDCVHTTEAPPEHYRPLDWVDPQSTLPENRLIAWEPIASPRFADLYAVRLGFLTPAPKNNLVPGYSIGGPASHKLWEFVVDGHITSFHLPELPAGLYTDGSGNPVPLLRNPAPSVNQVKAAHRYGERTLEVEYNGYLMGDGKVWDYNDNFLFVDMNRASHSVSQDSYLFTVE